MLEGKGPFLGNLSIPLNDLKRQYEALKPVLDDAVARVLASGWYILGPGLEDFEHEFAEYCQTSYCMGVASGTDALEIDLRALGVSRGDKVITFANAGMYSTTAIRATGAIPVFAGIDSVTMTMDPATLPDVITPRTRAVVVTHLYGRMAHMPELASCASQNGPALIEDCAQAHGAQFDGRRAGSWGHVDGEMIYHLYVVRTSRRDSLRTALRERGIGCDVHYPIPDHLQPACADLGYGPGVLPETERAAAEVLTLPCFAELTPAEVERVIIAVKGESR